MSVIAEMIREIAVLLLLFAFLELLLPQGKTAAFIRLALSLLLTLVILGPLAELLGRDVEDILPEWELLAAEAGAEHAQQGQRMALALEQEARDEYGDNMARQMAALARLRPGVAEAAARISATEDGALAGVQLYIKPEAGAEPAALGAEVELFIAEFYGLAADDVTCYIAEDGAEDGGS